MLWKWGWVAQYCRGLAGNSEVGRGLRLLISFWFGNGLLTEPKLGKVWWRWGGEIRGRVASHKSEEEILNSTQFNTKMIGLRSPIMGFVVNEISQIKAK